MPLPELLPRFVLASGSPRRKLLLEQAGLTFITTRADVDESFDPGLAPLQVVDELARRKLVACKKLINENLVLTADTLVFKENDILGKPQDKKEAQEMLHFLSGTNHQVTTSVCLGFQDRLHQFNTSTIVRCKSLSSELIDFYIDKYQPFDKAGSYGIQEWFGLVGIDRIEGSYTNVVGLPVAETFQALYEVSKKWNINQEID